MRTITGQATLRRATCVAGCIVLALSSSSCQAQSELDSQEIKLFFTEFTCDRIHDSSYGSHPVSTSGVSPDGKWYYQAKRGSPSSTFILYNNRDSSSFLIHHPHGSTRLADFSFDADSTYLTFVSGNQTLSVGEIVRLKLSDLSIEYFGQRTRSYRYPVYVDGIGFLVYEGVSNLVATNKPMWQVFNREPLAYVIAVYRDNQSISRYQPDGEKLNSPEEIRLGWTISFPLSTQIAGTNEFQLAWWSHRNDLQTEFSPSETYFSTMVSVDQQSVQFRPIQVVDDEPFQNYEIEMPATFDPNGSAETICLSETSISQSNYPDPMELMNPTSD